MESASNGHVQIKDTEGSQVGPVCLRNPLILKKILQHYSNSELLQFSLVNKQWNYAARTVIKDRGTLNAHLQSRHPCKSIAVFASHVRQMNVVPYSGIYVRFNGVCLKEACLRQALDSSVDVNVILNRLPVKNFEIGFDGYWLSYRKCPAFYLAERILQKCCGVLESLDVSVSSNLEKFIRQTIPQSTFPHLKTLKLGRFHQRLERAESSLIKDLVSRAPKLQELYLDHASVVQSDLLAGSSAVLELNGEIDLLDGAIHDGLIGALRLRRMRLLYSPNFSTERFNRIVPVVLQTARYTLHSLTLDSMFAPSLMHYGIQLENVTKLKIFLKCLSVREVQLDAADVSASWRIIQNFDFGHIFPKLNEVDIISPGRLGPQGMNQFHDEGNIILLEPNPDRTVNIKHLGWKHFFSIGDPINVPFLASMFPHIEKLSIENQDGPAPAYGLIWEHWVHLKQLDVRDRGVWRHNLDSLFCGLFPDEIAQLREQDEEYLKAVNIVPVMPSITCMKELRTFTLSDWGHGLYCEENNPAYVFSQVTALIAFSRNPKLTVTIQTTSKYENAWSHMKKYASIVLIE